MYVLIRHRYVYICKQIYKYTRIHYTYLSQSITYTDLCRMSVSDQQSNVITDEKSGNKPGAVFLV